MAGAELHWGTDCLTLGEEWNSVCLPSVVLRSFAHRAAGLQTADHQGTVSLFVNCRERGRTQLNTFNSLSLLFLSLVLLTSTALSYLTSDCKGGIIVTAVIAHHSHKKPGTFAVVHQGTSRCRTVSHATCRYSHPRL